jgi:hypothetical protein
MIPQKARPATAAAGRCSSRSGRTARAKRRCFVINDRYAEAVGAGRALRLTGPAPLRRLDHFTGGFEMARGWEQARAHLVSQRQSLIEQLAKGFVTGESEHQVDLLLKIQAAIDVLDTADESDEDEEDDEDEDD